MKKLFKRLLPRKAADILRYFRNIILLNRVYNVDKNRYKKSAFGIKIKSNQENLEAKITMNYHSLEKGLSNINFRNGFGRSAYTELIETMNIFYDSGFELNNSIAFQNALSVLNEYVKKHESTKIDISYIQNTIDRYKTNDINKTGGVIKIERKTSDYYSDSNFEDLAMNRHSVRDYSIQPISIGTINKAIEIATKTPSTCNRQPWFTYVIKNQELIQSTLKIQGGLGGFGHNIDTLILVTSNNNNLQKYSERNQGFIDAGMYSMSLIYALQYLGLASCALNAVFTIKKDKQIRKLLNIPINQNLIMFIAVGNYPETFKVAKSFRYNVEKITKILD